MIKRLGKGICDLRLEIYILEKSILRLNMFKINKRYKFFILLRKKENILESRNINLVVFMISMVCGFFYLLVQVVGFGGWGVILER